MREETLAAKIYRDRPGLALELGATSQSFNLPTFIKIRRSYGGDALACHE